MSEQIDKLDTSTRGGGPLTPKQREAKQAKFLKAYRETANIKISCKRAGVSRQTFYNWRDNDPSFAAQLPDADADANDTLEYAAYDRAVQGVPSYVVSQGRMVYEEIPVFNKDGTPKLDAQGKQVMLRGKPLVERKYSDPLLQTLLKARLPEKYKDRSAHEHTGKDGGPIKVERHQDLARLTDDELEQVEKVLLAAREREDG